jgi:hypothetical protein
MFWKQKTEYHSDCFVDRHLLNIDVYRHDFGHYRRKSVMHATC